MVLLLPVVSPAQERAEPRIAVVLSGGGAKGLAHIGVLKALENAGIYPDIITGTSMGSVIGGLYATGYSADEIAEIARNMDWDKILSNQVPLSQIAFEEKAYYGRYIAELPVINNQPKLPQGLIEGQKLHEELSRLTRSVHDIRDFDQLPIPFRAVATNIATGERVVLSKGFLPTAIRASMAIPTVFTPVKINDTLLVDGGLVRNFPVQEAIDMGADIIIGVFVSTDLETVDGLEDMFDILLQSSWVMSAYDSRAQRKLVNMYIAPELAEFGTMGFDQADSIISRGYTTGNHFQAQLNSLKDSLESVGKVFKKPIVDIAKDSLYIGNVSIVGNDKISDDFILGKLNLKPKQKIAITELNRKIEQVYGTRYFKKIDYELRSNHEITDIQINVIEVIQTRLKGALHYNNERRVGLNLNLTIRNKLLNNSRLIAELDIAENPRLDLSYLKYTGIDQGFAVTTGLSLWEYELPLIEETTRLATFQYERRNTFITIQNTSNPISSGGLTIQGFSNTFRPDVSGVLTSVEKGVERSVDINAFWAFNSSDKPFFPTTGWKGRIKVGHVPHNKIDLSFINLDSVLVGEIISGITYETFSYLDAQVDHLIKFSEHFTGYYGFHLLATTSSSIGLNYEGGIGGFYINYPTINPFWGMEFYEFQLTSYSFLKSGFQWEFLPDVYVSGQINYINTKYPITWWNPDFSYDDLRGESGLLGGGIGLGYESVIGPIQINLARSENSQKWLFGINVGFQY